MKITPFVPHSLEHLTQAHVFPTPLPQAAYDKMLADYAAIDDVVVNDITYESDGLAITGLCALPAKLTPRAHPVLIYNRGGSGEYGKLTLINVLRSMVPFARQGYLVYASNYRGNAGSVGAEEFGGADVHDVLNLLALAQNSEYYDGKNSFMLGHSRGGMMAYLAIKQGAKLNAAITLAGIADAHDMARNIGLEERVLKRRIPGYTADPEGTLSLRSAVKWPEAITTPLLLIHGDNDKDVPAEHSIALSKLVPHSKLHIIAGGNHALYRQWDEVLALCTGWLKRYSV